MPHIDGKIQELQLLRRFHVCKAHFWMGLKKVLTLIYSTSSFFCYFIKIIALALIGITPQKGLPASTWVNCMCILNLPSFSHFNSGVNRGAQLISLKSYSRNISFIVPLGANYFLLTFKIPYTSFKMKFYILIR